MITSKRNREYGSQGKVRLHSLIVMFSTIISRLLGIVRVRVIASFFGAGAAADIINFAFALPNNFRKLLAEGALTSALIPVLSRTIHDDEELFRTQSIKGMKAQELISRILAFQFLIILPIIIAVYIFPDTIVRFLSDFSDSEVIHETSRLLRFFIIYLLLISIIAVIQAVLHCRSRFFITSAAPLVFSVSVIFSILFLSEKFGINSMAIGILGGGILQLILLTPGFYRLKYKYLLRFSFKNPDFRKVISSMLPVFLTSAIAIISQQVAIYLASTLGEGGVTAFSNSIVFWQMPFGVFFGSIATVFFPLMSRASLADDTRTFATTVGKGIQYLFVFLLPSTVIFLGLSEELVYSILQSGKFTSADAIRTANTLFFFAPGLFFAGLFNFMQRVFYAGNRYRYSVYAMCIYITIDITVTITCIHAGLDTSSLGIGNSIGYAAATLYQLVLVKRLLPVFDYAYTFEKLGKTFLANVPLGLMVAIYTHSNPVWHYSGSNVRNMLILAAIGIACVAVTAASYRIVSIDFLIGKRNQ